MTASEWALLHAFRAWPAERGYRLADSKDRHGMDFGFDSFQGPLATIEITADRGQWFVEVVPAGAPEGRYDMECWSRALGDPRDFHESSPHDSWHLEPQLHYLKERLPAIEAALDADRRPQTIELLKAAALATAVFPPRRRTSNRGRSRDIQRP